MKLRFAGDTLAHRDQTFELVDQPLERYFDLIGTRPDFEPVSTQGRGYAAQWVVEDGWLFLVSISARWSDEEALTVQHLFPFAGKKVFAAWYNGVVRGYRRDRTLPNLSDQASQRYPDMTLQVAHGRVNNAVMADTPSVVELAGASDSADVVDLEQYRQATINAAWEDVMV